MVETAGQKLRKAREKRNWSVEDVARSTRIHPDRVRDLEIDEYGNFPNLSYGRNFLLLYARHLGMDPKEVTESYANENMFGLDDYEYMHTERQQALPAVISDKPHRPLVPLLVGFFAITIMLALIVGFLVITAKRITSDPGTVAQQEAVEEPLETADPAPAPAPAPVAVAEPSPAPAIEVTPPPLPPAPAGPGEDVPVMRAVPVNAAETPAAVENVIVLQALRDTRIIVRRGTSADASIVFDSMLALDAAPLTLRGGSFRIQVEGGAEAVKITRNGAPVPYTAPALVIE